MAHKSMPAQFKVKAAGESDGLEDGQFEAIVSVFDNIDAYGDVVMPGAFKDTLAEWAASGDPIPVYYSHQMQDLGSLLGEVIEAKETEQGLWVKAQLDVDDPDNVSARRAHKQMQRGLLKQFSFAYDVLEGGMEKRQTNQGEEPEEFYALRKLKLYEVGPTPLGANQETELLDVKTAKAVARSIAARAGAAVAAEDDDALRKALSQLDACTQHLKDVLAVTPPADEDDTKAEHDPAAKDEDPKGKSEEPWSPSPADLSALQSIELAAL